jgi:hypothetical protein
VTFCKQTFWKRTFRGCTVLIVILMKHWTWKTKDEPMEVSYRFFVFSTSKLVGQMGGRDRIRGGNDLYRDNQTLRILKQIFKHVRYRYVL